MPRRFHLRNRASPTDAEMNNADQAFFPDSLKLFSKKVKAVLPVCHVSRRSYAWFFDLTVGSCELVALQLRAENAVSPRLNKGSSELRAFRGKQGGSILRPNSGKCRSIFWLKHFHSYRNLPHALPVLANRKVYSMSMDFMAALCPRLK
jgi:hypothetical protein